LLPAFVISKRFCNRKWLYRQFQSVIHGWHFKEYLPET
jgi:hypothetical protein